MPKIPKKILEPLFKQLRNSMGLGPDWTLWINPYYGSCEIRRKKNLIHPASTSIDFVKCARFTIALIEEKEKDDAEEKTENR